MGGLCPTGIAVSESILIEAPSETLWEVLSDLDALPSILSTVKAIQNIDKNDGGKIPFEVGQKVRETRFYKGKEYTLRRTVTSIQDNEQHRSVSFHCDYGETMELHHSIRDICNTITLTILPVANNTSALDNCQLLGSFAVESAGLCTRLQFCFCNPCIFAHSRSMFVVELQEYAAAAMARVSKPHQHQ
jgi:Polyketide cyclase / dehydrase and lipid transport